MFRSRNVVVNGEPETALLYRQNTFGIINPIMREGVYSLPMLWGRGVSLGAYWLLWATILPGADYRRLPCISRFKTNKEK